MSTESGFGESSTTLVKSWGILQDWSLSFDVNYVVWFWARSGFTLHVKRTLYIFLGFWFWTFFPFVFSFFLFKFFDKLKIESSPTLGSWIRLIFQSFSVLFELIWFIISRIEMFNLISANRRVNIRFILQLLSDTFESLFKWCGYFDKLFVWFQWSLIFFNFVIIAMVNTIVGFVLGII